MRIFPDHRPLPNFMSRLQSRRDKIARCLSLNSSDESVNRESDAAVEDRAHWLNRAWLFPRHLIATTRMQRNERYWRNSGPAVKHFTAVLRFNSAVLIQIGTHLAVYHRQSGPFRLLIGAVSPEEAPRASHSGRGTLVQ